MSPYVAEDHPLCLGWEPNGRPDPDDPTNHRCARYAAYAVSIPGTIDPAQLVCRFCLAATVGVAGIVGGALHHTDGLVFVQVLT